MTEIKKGLAGVVVDETAISKVVPETNSLTYRGYPVQDLATQCSIEEVAYLLWNGELATPEQLAEFEAGERGQRVVGDDALAVLQATPGDSDPMDTLRTVVSFLGSQDRDGSNDQQALQKKALSLFAKMPTLVAADIRRREGRDPIQPDSSLTYVENFFYMVHGKVPDADVKECFETSMVLYAEHSFNASTFAGRVITSTLSDLYSAVVGAIGALKGPLHGGANEAVMRMMLEIDDPDKAADWMREALARKQKIMGFGHRVYRNGDSRVPTMKDALIKMARSSGAEGEKWVQMYDELERTMREEKNIFPNLDFPAGPAYYLMGFDTNMFTPFFVMARTIGWTAHFMEQLEANSLIRPLSEYVGPAQRDLPAR